MARTYDEIRGRVLGWDASLAEEIATWIYTRRGPEGLIDLLSAHEKRLWRDTSIVTPVTHHELSASQRQAVRERAIVLLGEAGGKLTIRGVLWETDGKRLWAEMEAR